MHFLNEYGLFLLKTFTIAVGILLTVAGLMALAQKNKMANKLNIRKLNKYYQDIKNTLNEAILPKDSFKSALKAQKKLDKSLNKGIECPKIFVLNFKGDVRASEVHALTEEITAVLTVAKPRDEVLVRLESPGGVVFGYGLAASQLQRIKQQGIRLTIAVDKIAASGGYMMACIGDQILSAPFAIIGSIGVVAQLPNFHHLLKKNHIEFEQLTAGEYKRTLTLFGENTDEGRKKLQEQLEETHVIFKHFIKEQRPIVDIDRVATGEHWLAVRALELNLVDRLITSDDYLMQAAQTHDLYEVSFLKKKTLGEKFSVFAHSLLSKF